MQVPTVSFHTGDPLTNSHLMSLFVWLVLRTNPTRHVTITGGSETLAVVDKRVMLELAVRGVHGGPESNNMDEYVELNIAAHLSLYKIFSSQTKTSQLILNQKAKGLQFIVNLSLC